MPTRPVRTPGQTSRTSDSHNVAKLLDDSRLTTADDEWRAFLEAKRGRVATPRSQPAGGPWRSIVPDAPRVGHPLSGRALHHESTMAPRARSTASSSRGGYGELGFERAGGQARPTGAPQPHVTRHVPRPVPEAQAAALAAARERGWGLRKAEPDREPRPGTSSTRPGTSSTRPRTSSSIRSAELRDPREQRTERDLRSVRDLEAYAEAAGLEALEHARDGAEEEAPEQQEFECWDEGEHIGTDSPRHPDGARMAYRERREAFLMRLMAEANLGKKPARKAEPEQAEEPEEPAESAEEARRVSKFRSMVRLGRERYAVLDDGGDLQRYTWNASFGWTRSLPPRVYEEADSFWVPSRRQIPSTESH